MKLWNEVILDEVKDLIKDSEKPICSLQMERSDILKAVKGLITKHFGLEPFPNPLDEKKLFICLKDYQMTFSFVEHLIELDAKNLENLKYYKENVGRLSVASIFNPKREYFIRNEIAKFKVNKAVKEAEERAQKQAEILKMAEPKLYMELDSQKLAEAGEKPEDLQQTLLLGCCGMPFVRVFKPVLKKVVRKNEPAQKFGYKIPKWTWCFTHWCEENRKEYEAHATRCLKKQHDQYFETSKARE